MRALQAWPYLILVPLLSALVPSSGEARVRRCTHVFLDDLDRQVVSIPRERINRVFGTPEHYLKWGFAAFSVEGPMREAAERVVYRADRAVDWNNSDNYATHGDVQTIGELTTERVKELLPAPLRDQLVMNELESRLKWEAPPDIDVHIGDTFIPHLDGAGSNSWSKVGPRVLISVKGPSTRIFLPPDYPLEAAGLPPGTRIVSFEGMAGLIITPNLGQLRVNDSETDGIPRPTIHFGPLYPGPKRWTLVMDYGIWPRKQKRPRTSK